MSDKANMNKLVTELNNKIIYNYYVGYYCKNKRSFIKMSTKTTKIIKQGSHFEFLYNEIRKVDRHRLSLCIYDLLNLVGFL